MLLYQHIQLPILRNNINLCAHYICFTGMNGVKPFACVLYLWLCLLFSSSQVCDSPCFIPGKAKELLQWKVTMIKPSTQDFASNVWRKMGTRMSFNLTWQRANNTIWSRPYEAAWTCWEVKEQFFSRWEWTMTKKSTSLTWSSLIPTIAPCSNQWIYYRWSGGKERGYEQVHQEEIIFYVAL